MQPQIQLTNGQIFLDLWTGKGLSATFRPRMSSTSSCRSCWPSTEKMLCHRGTMISGPPRTVYSERRSAQSQRSAPRGNLTVLNARSHGARNSQ